MDADQIRRGDVVDVRMVVDCVFPDGIVAVRAPRDALYDVGPKLYATPDDIVRHIPQYRVSDRVKAWEGDYEGEVVAIVGEYLVIATDTGGEPYVRRLGDPIVRRVPSKPDTFEPIGEAANRVVASVAEKRAEAAGEAIGAALVADTLAAVRDAALVDEVA